MKKSPKEFYDEEQEEEELQLCDLLHSLELCRSVTEGILSELEALKEDILNHRSKALRTKTAGTTAMTIGTGLAVTGLIMAPFTFGTSLIVSSVGAVTSLGGAATTMITDVVSNSKRKNYLQNAQEFVEQQEFSKKVLSKQLDLLNERILPLISQGLSKSEAIYAVLINKDSFSPLTDSENDEDDEDFEWVENTQRKWKPVKQFAFRAGIQSLKLMKNSQALNVMAASGASTASNVSLGVGRILGTAVFKTALAAVGVIFTSIDIALLVKEWKEQDPTIESVNYVVEELKGELQQFVELEGLLKSIEDCKVISVDIPDLQCNVVGSSPVTLKSLIALIYAISSERAHNLYGIDSGDFNIDDLKNYFVGVECNGLQEAVFQRQITQSPRSPSLELELNSSLQNLITFNGESMVPVQVFNLEILKLNAQVIDFLLEKTGSVPISKIAQTNRSLNIVKDYWNPLPQSDKTALQDIFVSYLSPKKGYINANNWEYDMIVENIQSASLLLFSKELERLKNQDNDSADHDKDNCMENLVDFLEIIISHRSYIDPVAAAIWSFNEFNSQRLQEIEKKVACFVRTLRFRLTVWAYEISELRAEY